MSRLEDKCLLLPRIGCPLAEITQTFFSCFSTLSFCTNDPLMQNHPLAYPSRPAVLATINTLLLFPNPVAKKDLEHRRSGMFQYNDQISYEACFRGGRGSARLGRKCETRKKYEGVRKSATKSAKKCDRVLRWSNQKLPLWGYLGWETENPVLMMIDDMANRVWHGGNGALTRRCTRDTPNRVMHSANGRGPAMRAV